MTRIPQGTRIERGSREDRWRSQDERSGRRTWHVSSADAEILRAGPEHELYWETWANVEDRAHLVDNGRTYHLHLDGDLFAVAIDAMTDAEYLEFFGEDR